MILPVCFSVMMGGAICNAYDRLVHGYVLVLVVLYYQNWYWPAVNVADSAICLGAVLLIVDMFKNKEEKHG